MSRALGRRPVTLTFQYGTVSSDVALPLVEWVVSEARGRAPLQLDAAVQDRSSPRRETTGCILDDAEIADAKTNSRVKKRVPQGSGEGSEQLLEEPTQSLQDAKQGTRPRAA